MKDRWRDLSPRVLSAAVLIGLAVAAAFAGPFAFSLLISCVTGFMIWELVRMLDPARDNAALALGLGGTALVMASLLSIWPSALVPQLLGALLIAALVWIIARRDRLTGAAYAAAIMITGFVLSAYFHSNPRIVFAVVLLVALTDIAGYFAGKSIGGRKFWPSISPKKTWSGILAGWAAAALLGGIIVARTDAPGAIVLVAIGMSFASQLGDIVESAFKRRAGVKDSSHLIPGHGGFLDRFDGVVGATMALIVGLLLVDI